MEIFPYKIIAGLLTVLGLLLLVDGVYLHKTGKIITSRYETGSGKFLRKISAEDQAYYSSMKILKKISFLLNISGSLIFLFGIFSFAKPEILYLAIEHFYSKRNPGAPAP
jgi:hypothetical protein